jgi:YD repeat-containing protein
MKKIFTLAAIALFTLASCSDDSDSDTVNNPGTNPAETGLLLKKSISNDQTGQSISIFNYNDQNKLISITSPDELGGTYFYYSGNLISRIETLYDDTFSTKELYEYDSQNRLVTYTIYDYTTDLTGTEVDAFKNTYTYNANGTITTRQYHGNETEQNISGPSSTVFTMSNGNIIKKVVTYDESLTTTTTNYTFDNKNTPDKNMIGFNVFILADQVGGINNVTSVNTDDVIYNSSTTYTYNDAGYPITETNTTSQGETTTQYFYE